MSLRVAPYEAADAPVLRALLAACQAHYDLPALAREDVDAMLAEAAAPGGAEVLLAWRGGGAVGFAVLVPVWPVAEGTALYLKELFVAADARGSGAGRALMAAAAASALRCGAGRLQWETSQPRAEGFYDGLGAVRTGLVTYEMPAEGLAALAAGAR